MHIINAPFEWFNRRMVEWLASQIRMPISVLYRGATIRVRITFNITIALLRLLLIEHDGVEKKFYL